MATEVVLQTLDVLLVEPVAMLHFDEHERHVTDGSDSMRRSPRHVDRVTGAHSPHVAVDGHLADARDDEPVLRAEKVALVTQPPTRRHLQPLDLVGQRGVEDLVRTPRPGLSLRRLGWLPGGSRGACTPATSHGRARLVAVLHRKHLAEEQPECAPSTFGEVGGSFDLLAAAGHEHLAATSGVVLDSAVEREAASVPQVARLRRRRAHRHDEVAVADVRPNRVNAGEAVCPDGRQVADMGLQAPLDVFGELGIRCVEHLPLDFAHSRLAHPTQATDSAPRGRPPNSGDNGQATRETEPMRRRPWRERALVRALPYLRPHRRRLVVIITTSVLSSVMFITTPLIVKLVIDGPLADGDRAGVARWAALAAAIAVVEYGLARTRRTLLAVLATDLETELRNELYAKLQALDLGFHDRWQSGQLLSRAMTDLAIVRRFIGFGAVFFVLISIQVIGIFGALASLHLPLTLLTFVAAVPVVYLCSKFEREYHAIVRRLQDQTGDLTTSIEEGAKGVRIIKAFGRRKEVFEAYAAECRAIHDTQLDRIKLHTKFVWVLGTIPNLTLTAVLLAGVLAVGSGGLTLGGLVAFVSYVLMLVFPLDMLGWIMALAGEAETAAVRVYEVFDTEPAIADKPGAVELTAARGAVRFECVSFSYEGSDKIALQGITVEVAPGETMAVVGATGSGKTTVATLLTRLYDPTEGRITLDGHDLRDLTVRSLRAQVGFAFEEPTLFSASVRENLLMGKPDATEEEVLEALRVSQATFALDLPWGLDTRIGEQGLSLSGGQRQRLALARAIIGKPRVLVLDDPLSALDVHTEALVQGALRPLLRDSTVFLVVHRPSTIALADRAMLLEGGRLVAVGTHHELLETEPRYRAVLSEEAEDLGEEEFVA